MTNTGFEAARAATVNGTTLAYREQGEGEPVVFVHGGISDLRTWEQQLPAVGRFYRAIAYSRRFARPNDDIDPVADYPMLPHVEDLAGFLREIDAALAHLVGNSWGAFICLLAAVRHPDAVRTVVIAEPPILPLLRLSTPPRSAELLRLFMTRPRTAIAVLEFGAGTIAPVQKAFQRTRTTKRCGPSFGRARQRASQSGYPRRARSRRAPTSARCARSCLARDILRLATPTSAASVCRSCL